jgi:nucleoside-diphosphate-sugar epimerase
VSVLVTGVNGLIGLHTARILLDEGYEVVGYDQNRWGELAFYPEVADGPGMDPYVSQSPIRGPLDISRAKRELSYQVGYDLKGSLGDFIETLRQRGTVTS